ncbi:hypothetical protein BED47_00695 [Gottfriedia luciferensis]|uniref:Uncharacterized protein n=1 Tax=Gottfriedia luciferensis TaxID=178774 RepID=A0ABX2ZVB1_9BACI|nr:hypothetical protein [Gottfriedia luciferensis]ODG93721.1 hypothetical protein BED47_00695 [Gottfriedia luciferensis]
MTILTKNFNDELFVRGYNSFANTKSKFHLDEDEFYIYSILFTRQYFFGTIHGSIETSIDMINQYSPIKFIQNDTKNRSKIKSIVQSLINKEVFILQNNIEDLKNHTLLFLTINDMELSNDGVAEDKQNTDEDKFQNFTKIPFSKLTTFESTRDLYIYYVVSKFNEFKFSYESWANLIGVKIRSAIAIIDDAISRGIIYKKVGDYTEKLVGNQKQQDINTYSIHPFNEQQKGIQTLKVESEEVNVKVVESVEVKVETEITVRPKQRGFGTERPQQDTTKDITDMLAIGIDPNEPVESYPVEDNFSGYDPNFTDILNAESPYEFMDEEISNNNIRYFAKQNGKIVPFGKVDKETDKKQRSLIDITQFVENEHLIKEGR